MSHQRDSESSVPTEDNPPIEIENRDEFSNFIQSHQVAIQKKELEIDEHRRDIAKLCQRASSILPVFTIPDEILVEIFLEYISISRVFEKEEIYELDDYVEWPADYNSDQEEDEYDEYWEDYDERWWLVPSHVCHHWRNVVLSAPILWTQLNADICLTPCLLSAALERSLEAPLDVSIKGFAYRQIPGSLSAGRALAQLFKVTHRIHNLELKFSVIALEKRITHKYIRQPFLQLKTLKVSATEAHSYQNLEEEPGCSIAPVILKNITPCLTELRLCGMRVEWTDLLSLPPSLSHLHISRGKYQYRDWNPRSHNKDVLAVLRKQTSLETLHLENVISDNIIVGTVDLPRLQKLSLRDTAARAVDFFRCLVLPPTTLLDLDLTVDPTDDGVQRICSYIFARIRRYAVETNTTIANAHVTIGYKDISFALCGDRCYSKRHPYLFSIMLQTTLEDLSKTLWQDMIFPTIGSELLLSIQWLYIGSESMYIDHWSFSEWFREVNWTILVDGKDPWDEMFE
ncbi:hypothetical protein QCA50_019750 [Cerrena zonata]|uniref:F-box domain-containing protein n=1 Tax=Cerrena zonata TaxID=2478898 RepID=A0AAW0FD37_9APHY